MLRGVRQQQDEQGRFSICSRQAAVVQEDKMGEQLSILYPGSPFTGRK
jgi:hypothetical protein